MLATANFPASATANGRLPSLQCYFSNAAAGPYVQFSSAEGMICAIGTDETGTYGFMSGLAPGEYGSFVVTY